MSKFELLDTGAANHGVFRVSEFSGMALFRVSVRMLKRKTKVFSA